MRSLSRVLAGAAFAVAAATMVSGPAVADEWVLTDKNADGKVLWSITLDSLTGANGYTGGPVQTWPDQINEVGYTGWADFATSGEEIFWEAGTPPPSGAFEAGSPFFSVDGKVIDLFIPTDGIVVVDGVGSSAGQFLTLYDAPEPASAALAFAGFGGLLMARRRRAKAA